MRELENICERMAAFFSQWEDKEKIAFDELHHDCPELYSPNAGQTDQGGAGQPREPALPILALCGGNRQEAARRLGVSPPRYSAGCGKLTQRLRLFPRERCRPPLLKVCHAFLEIRALDA